MFQMSTFTANEEIQEEFNSTVKSKQKIFFFFFLFFKKTPLLSVFPLSTNNVYRLGT